MTAEMSIDVDSSPERSTCFSAESDFEAERLSNLEEEDNDHGEINEDIESQSSDELEYSRRKETSSCNVDRNRRKHNRYIIAIQKFQTMTV